MWLPTPWYPAIKYYIKYSFQLCSCYFHVTMKQNWTFVLEGGICLISLFRQIYKSELQTNLKVNTHRPIWSSSSFSAENVPMSKSAMQKYNLIRFHTEKGKQFAKKFRFAKTNYLHLELLTNCRTTLGSLSMLTLRKFPSLQLYTCLHSII